MAVLLRDICGVLLQLGQPLILGTLGITTATTAVLLQQTPAVAQDASAVARVAKAITVRIEDATQGLGALMKKKEVMLKFN